MKFQSRPVIVEAEQFTGENVKEILEFASPHAYYSELTKKIRCRTRNGEVTVKPTDWVIVTRDEAYPVPHDVMSLKYTKYAELPPLQDWMMAKEDDTEDGDTKTGGDAGDVTVL
jgi:hypothetical protein